MDSRIVAALSVLLPPAVAPANATAGGVFVAQFDHVLGTSLSLKIAAQSWELARLAERAILQETARLEALLSSFSADSEFSRWVSGPVGVSVPVSADLFAVLTHFDNWQHQSLGAINAGAEAISRLWQQAAKTQTLPTEAARQKAIDATVQRHWRLIAETQTAIRTSSTPLRLHTFTKSFVLDKAADAALALPGIEAVVLNSGGDLVIRGNRPEVVAIANPIADAENATPLTHVSVQNTAIATSGSYRRGVQIGADWFSHIIDPRIGKPTQDIVSATVIHPDAVTAGALATAYTILSPVERETVAARWPDAAYWLVTNSGETVTSLNWPNSKTPTAPKPANTANVHLLSVAAKDKLWNANQELLITVELARFEGRSHRPFVAVWIEDEAGNPVRQLALWYNKPRWLPELREWYSLRTADAASVTSATRAPGSYTLVWDGKDDKGQWVKQGKYTVFIEAAREHGSYQLIRQTMDFNGKLKQQPLNGNVEIASAALDYREKTATR